MLYQREGSRERGFSKYQKTVVLVQFNQLTIRYLHEFFATLCLPQYKVIDDV